jgi:plastocyanin
MGGIALGATLVLGSLALARGGAHAGGACRGMPVRDEATTTVEIEQGTCFEPAIVRVAPGATVTWENPADGLPHSVTGANSSWGDYGEVSPGVSVSYDFPEKGVYPYFCFLHPGMVGTVVVGNAPEGANVQSVSLSGRGLVPQSNTPASANSNEDAIDDPWVYVPIAAGIALALAGAGYVVGTRRGKS